MPACAIALALSLPVLVVIGFVAVPAGEVWRHLASTVLADYVVNSLILVVGVGLGTFVVGVGSAWLVSMCSFPGRGILEWALLLPMALPAYIIAYTYTGLLDAAGPVQSALRTVTGWELGSYAFPQVRSLAGAVVMLSLVLYPYVYLFGRAAFLGQSRRMLEVGRSLGNGPWRTFLTVALPLARPALVAGLSLTIMETLADYGTVQYFGVATFTTGIFRTWHGLDDAAAAAQLAAALVALVFAVIVFEQRSRRGARFDPGGGRHAGIPRIPLAGVRAAAATVLCVTPVVLGFVVPAAQLAAWTARAAEIDAAFLRLAANTFGLGLGVAFLALALALFLGYAQRLADTPPTRVAAAIAGMGYAVPGAVVAIGVMIPFGWFDNTLDAFLRARIGVSSGLLLSGTLAALVFAYLVRFLPISLRAVEAGLVRLRPSLDEAGRSLGATPLRVLTAIHLPMLRGSMVIALLMVFVDVLKELPATLILRPFNFDTLAVRAYELASDERLADAAPASLAIVAAGILPVVVLSRAITRPPPSAGGPEATLRAALSEAPR